MARLTPALQSLLRLPDEARRIGPFFLVRQLGRGGFAPVWLAKEMYGSTELRTAAVKLFSLAVPSGAPGGLQAELYRSQVVDEARALCQVEHPGIVRFYALPTDEARGLMGLAMEHLAGTSLDRRLAARGTLPLAETLAVGTMVASALSAVHRAGLVHRDVKPANVVESAGSYRLIDFGIAAATEVGPRRAAVAEHREPGGSTGSVVLVDDLPLEVGVTEPAAPESTEAPGAGSATAWAPLSGTPGYVDPCCLATGARATPASDLYALGAMLFECVTGKLPAACGASGQGLDPEITEGRASAPSLLSIAPLSPPMLARLVDSLLAADRRARPRSAEWVAIELERLRGALAGLDRALPPEAVGPFRGLGRFEASDRDVYFGRTSEVAAALEVLRGRGTLALVGPSGSGKSSLARAGVLPRVAEGALGGWPRLWDTATAVPGVDARASLSAALATLEPPVAGAGQMTPEALVEALAERAQATDRGLCLLVDQLEELVTLGSGEGQAWMVGLLARLGEQTLPGLRTVLGVRRDLLDPLLGLGQLGDALVRGSHQVVPLDDAVWGEVIDQALSAYGYAFEDDALRARLLGELSGTAGAMPLVQFALTELWRMRDREGKRLTRAGLEAIGGVAGALERHADAALSRFLVAHPEGQPAARQVLLALTTAQGTRALGDAAELERAAGPATGELLALLTEARLLVGEPGGVTLAHDALLPQWGTLRRWLEEARDDRLLADEIERAAAGWRADPDPARLWKKRRLDAAQDVARRGIVQVSSGAMAFLAASRRSERRARGAVIFQVVLMLLVALAYGLLVLRNAHAERDRSLEERATADRHAALLGNEARLARNATRMAAARELQGDPTTALAILREVEPPGVPHGWSELTFGVAQGGVAAIVLSHQGVVSDAEWSPDGRHIVTASDDKLVRVWNADGTGEPLVLRGHEGEVNTASWSPDGKRIVTASADGTARVWNGDGSGEVVVLRGHDQTVKSAAWSPDGKRVVTASADKTARVWNADGGGVPLILRGHEAPVDAAAWSPDGRRILTVSWDKTARVWSADGTGNPLILRGHTDAVRMPAWSPDSKRVVTASSDRTARVWNADGTGKPLILRGHEDSVFSAAWSPDGKRIVTASYDGTARLWSADGTGLALRLYRHGRGVIHAAWSPDGKRIVTASKDNLARVWNADGTGEPLIWRGAPGLTAPMWSPESRRLVVARASDNALRVWNADGTGEPLVLRGHAGTILWEAWSLDGKRIVTASRDKTARVWSADGTGGAVVLGGHEAGVNTAEWSPDGRRIVTASGDKTARVWNADGTGVPLVLRGHEDAVNLAKWSPDGKRIVTASDDETVRVWNADDGAGEPLVARFKGSVQSAEWSPDGRRIAAGSWSLQGGTARVWSPDDTREPLTLRDALQVTWSRDGQRLATTSGQDNAVRVWNADGTGEPVVLRGSEDELVEVSWSPDGKRLVGASVDKTALVWNADGAGDPLILRGHEGGVGSAEWSPDGKRLATGSMDGTVRVWTDLTPLASVADPRLWTGTTYCLPIERRMELLGISESTARADLAACQRHVAEARAGAASHD